MRKQTKLYQRLPYIAELIFQKRTAYEIGKEIHRKGLTSISTYSYCGNHNGELAIYQWVYKYLKTKPFNFGFKFKIYNYNMKELKEKTNEELIKKIKNLEKQNERLKKGIDERDQVIKIANDIIKDYIPVVKKDKINEKKNKFSCSLSINKLYKYLSLCRRNYYYIPKQNSKSDNITSTLHNVVKTVWEENKKLYGRPKLLFAINSKQIQSKLPTITDWQLRKIMKELNIYADLARKHNKRKDPKNTKFHAPNLIKRKWHVNQPYKHLFTDITYLETKDGKHIYISVIIDTFNWKILAWNCAEYLTEDLVTKMLNKIKIDISRAIIHTDHGSHYSAHEYQEWLKSRNCLCSMSRLANSLDNYPIEHHFSILKIECLYKIKIENRDVKNVEKELNDYYDFYNNKRIQRNKKLKYYFVPNHLLTQNSIISNKKVVQI